MTATVGADAPLISLNLGPTGPTGFDLRKRLRPTGAYFTVGPVRPRAEIRAKLVASLAFEAVEAPATRDRWVRQQVSKLDSEAGQ